MKNDKTIKLFFIAGTVFFAIFFIVLVINIYNYILTDAKKNHQIQQMEMAKAAISGINSYLRSLSDDMRLLSNYPGVRKFDKQIIKANTDLLLNHYSDKIVKSIFILDKEERQIYNTGEMSTDLLLDDTTFDIKAIPNNEPYFSNIEPIYKREIKRGLAFIMLMPFGETRERKSEGKNIAGIRIVGDEENPDKGDIERDGYIGFIVSFDSLVHKYIVPLKLGEKDFAWILDGEGRLIYHPTHKDMLLRSIMQTSSSCLKCHNSFDTQKKMIKGNPSFDEYTIGNEPPKIMAYVPLNLAGEKWILAISTFLPEVTSNLRDRISLFFGLGILILIVILSLGSLLYFQTINKIRVEESNLHMEQRQNFQDQLSQAGKLASIGELVDSVAHEINTPLGIITSHIDALNLKNDYPLQFATDLEVIRNQTKRINNYTKSLLNYSHRIPFNPKQEKLTSLIDECLFLLNPLFHSKRIRITKIYKDNLPTIEIDRGQIEQVLINLLNNAADAISNNGEIKIEVGSENRNISSVNKDNIKYATIAITDNGSGIKPEDINNIFEAFFTTKQEGNGTGLGLPISKAIILRHKGKIEVVSEPDKFTTFKIFLPVNTKEQSV